MACSNPENPLLRAPRVYLAVVLLAALLSSGCSQEAADVYAGWDDKELYEGAKRSLEAADFGEAVKLFETLEARYPFGRYAIQTQLDIAYAYYKFNETDSALAAADRFIKLYPQHQSNDYAYYLKGLAHFNRGSGIFEWVMPRDFSKIDQNMLRASYREFDTLVRRYPNSAYAPDARQRMIYLRNRMADHEYATAQYYLRRGAVAGTINRVKFLLDNYDGAPVVPDALALLVRAYLSLGLNQLADETLELLRMNDPSHAELPELTRQVLLTLNAG